jgi:hypothetical protein
MPPALYPYRGYCLLGREAPATPTARDVQVGRRVVCEGRMRESIDRRVVCVCV